MGFLPMFTFQLNNTMRYDIAGTPIAAIRVVGTFGPCLTYGDAPALARVRLRESIAQTHHLASKIHRDPPPSPYSE